jgi:hypothetical protein
MEHIAADLPIRQSLASFSIIGIMRMSKYIAKADQPLPEGDR